jgi:opacity protein-like surface antigen
MRTKRILVFQFLLWVAALLCSNGVALAQGSKTVEYPKFEFFGGYSALGEATGPGISFGVNSSIPANYSSEAGFEASIIRNFNKYFGIKGDFSAHFSNDSRQFPVTLCAPTCTTATQDNQLKTRVYNFLAGPEFKARNKTRFTPFAYALGGVGHTSANFTSPSPTLNIALKRSDTGFAMALGGGLDIRATDRVSFRGSMDYNPIFVDDSLTARRDMVRISLGVLFH